MLDRLFYSCYIDFIDGNKQRKTQLINNMKGFTHQEIWLDRNGSPKTPTMAWVKGLFGIHTEINGGKFFVVTHIPTGKGVFYFNNANTPGLTVAKSKTKARELVALLGELDLTDAKLTPNQLRQIAYRVEMVRFNIPLDQAVVNIDKKFADIENMSKKDVENVARAFASV